MDLNRYIPNSSQRMQVVHKNYDTILRVTSVKLTPIKQQVTLALRSSDSQERVTIPDHANGELVVTPRRPPRNKLQKAVSRAAIMAPPKQVAIESGAAGEDGVPVSK